MRTREIKKELQHIENALGSINYVITILSAFTEEMRKQAEVMLKALESKRKTTVAKNAKVVKKSKSKKVAKKTTTKKKSVVAKIVKKQKIAKKVK